MRVVTQNDIKEFNKLYIELKTYAAVARATGFSPATVKKYIIKDYKEVEEANMIRFNRALPTEFDNSAFRVDDWGPLCVLNEQEVQDIKVLWNELEV